MTEKLNSEASERQATCSPNTLRDVLEKVYPGLSAYPPGSAAWQWAMDHPDLLSHALEQVVNEKTKRLSSSETVSGCLNSSFRPVTCTVPGGKPSLQKKGGKNV